MTSGMKNEDRWRRNYRPGAWGLEIRKSSGEILESSVSRWTPQNDDGILDTKY